MGASIIQEQHDIFIDTVKRVNRGDWKVLLTDEASRKILDNVVEEDEILSLNVTSIYSIEKRREPEPEMDAMYLLSPLPHILECLLADLDRQRYRSFYLVWTGVLEPQLRRRLDASPGARRIAGFETLTVDFFPRQSHLITFRDPWSFPILYHPGCNNLVRDHLQLLAQKITGVCVTLGEYPKVRYYAPRNAVHEASVLCMHLARFVQEELDQYAQYNRDFPPQTARLQGTLVITDRAMDITAPFVHEFTYEAMAHDLLPIREGDQIMYRTITNKGEEDEEEVDYELTDRDKVWVGNRHTHMKDTLEKLTADFRRFLDDHPQFRDDPGAKTSVSQLREMMGGMRDFMEMKQAYSLHLSMAGDAMQLFQSRNLPDVGSVEQTLATGMDEENRRAKNTLDSVVRLLDEPSVSPGDRLRLIVLYILHREGVIPNDISLLLAHADLPAEDAEVINNLAILGGHVTRALKEVRQPTPPLFPKNTKDVEDNNAYALSRFEPAMQALLEDLVRGTLDQTIFPYQKPPMDPNEDLIAAQQGSLRAGRPNWAAQGRKVPENRQRFIIFVAGGATFSENRVCHDVGEARGKDVFLVTSHMSTPGLFIRQLRDLSKDERRLDLPITRPKPRAPDWINERPPPPPQPKPMQAAAGGPRPPPGHRPSPSGSGMPARPGGAPPTAQMAGMSINNGAPRPPPQVPGKGGSEWPSSAPTPPSPASGGKPAKLEKEKKKRNFLGIKR
ncbi:Sec1 family protein [Plectosphaerella plurivora]|uniref:Sec1 family protein n=1 Tax=Plectosphaerella plurivora TaxID=936078 RepID=A0A9P8V0F7_9PEZI|nr:Sec1 family protein [Plectosphaerella plurivora]